MDAYQFYTEVYRLRDSDFVDKLVENSEKKHIGKGKLIVRIGETQKNINFMESGAIRGYFLDYSGKELTDCFACRRGEAIISSMKITPGMKSDLAIEVLRDGEFFCIPISVIFKLLEEFTEARELYIRLVNSAAEKHIEQKRVLASYSAMQKYKWFLETYPELIDCVKASYISSFLGIAPETLSRIRRASCERGEYRR